MSDNADVLTLHRGRTPLLVSFPHVGTMIAPEVRQRLVGRAGDVEDTDWHLAALYAFAGELGASMIVPTYSRYMVDLNRPPENVPMYPGVNNTELCPTRFFNGDALYRNQTPEAKEIAHRLVHYWHPYHLALEAELTRIRNTHGHAIVFDAHSIRSEVPWLFDGRLPDLNLGTADATSCSPALRQALTEVLQSQSVYSSVVDGRFKGGYITRHYGRPAAGLHAVQLEMTWRCYMKEELPYEIDIGRATAVQPILCALVQAMLDWKPNG